MYKFLIPLFALVLLIGCSRQQATPPATTGSETSSALSVDSSSASTLSAMSSLDTTATSTEAPAAFNGQMLTGKHTVILKTSKGNITIELDADAAPKTVTNFIVLAQTGYYNGLTFHRVIPDFMIQGGDPSGDGTGGTSIYGETFEDEPTTIPMVRGVLAMANRGPNTNGSQFFIIQTKETPWLQGRHTAFGHVTEGLDVLDAIVNVKADTSNKPLEPVTFTVEVVN